MYAVSSSRTKGKPQFVSRFDGFKGVDAQAEGGGAWASPEDLEPR